MKKINGEKLWGKDRRRRSRLEIFMDMIEVIDDGEDKPTRIMYATNLSWTSLNNHLDYLIKYGFVAPTLVGKGMRYNTTEECVEILNAYSFVKEKLGADTKDFHIFGDR